MVSSNTRALPSSLRRTNERTIISLLMRTGIASRAQLAKVAGISQPTCGKIIDEMLRMGVVREVEDTSPARTQPGRPGRMIRLDSSKPRFLAIQFDVLETSFALVPVCAPTKDHWDITRPTTNSAPDWIAQARGVARELGAKNLWGVLVSVPGIVDEEKGKILFSPNLHWSERTDMAALIQQIWNVPVLLVQENRAAALGHLYTASTSPNFFLADFGQGVGGAIVEGGRLFHSPLPLNSEFGHTPIPGNHIQCGCGAVGCLETKLSRSGLLRSFAEANRGEPQNWTVLLKHIERRGVQPWLEESLNDAASVIAGALNVLGIRRVVVTGSLAEMPQQVMERLTAAIRQGALWGRFGEVICEAAPHRRIAGLAAAGIDRLLVPADGERKFITK